MLLLNIFYCSLFFKLKRLHDALRRMFLRQRSGLQCTSQHCARKAAQISVSILVSCSITANRSWVNTCAESFDPAMNVDCSLCLCGVKGLIDFQSLWNLDNKGEEEKPPDILSTISYRVLQIGNIKVIPRLLLILLSYNMFFCSVQ